MTTTTPNALRCTCGHNDVVILSVQAATASTPSRVVYECHECLLLGAVWWAAADDHGVS